MNNEKIIGFKFFDPIKPPFGAIKDGRFLQKERAMFVISCTDFDEFGANCCCFGFTESIADGFD